VPRLLVTASSTCAAVRNSRTPRPVSSSRIGAMKNSGYTDGLLPRPRTGPTGPWHRRAADRVSIVAQTGCSKSAA
jgi:hypothetical protein